MLAWVAYDLLRLSALHLGSFESLWQTMLGLACLVSWLLLWILLLKRRTWAWWGLTVIYCGFALLVLYGVALTPSYWLARGKTFGPIVVMTILKLVMGAVFLIPLFFLLTDRPGGWKKALSTKH